MVRKESSNVGVSWTNWTTRGMGVGVDIRQGLLGLPGWVDTWFRVCLSPWARLSICGALQPVTSLPFILPFNTSTLCASVPSSSSSFSLGILSLLGLQTDNRARPRSLQRVSAERDTQERLPVWKERKCVRACVCERERVSEWCLCRRSNRVLLPAILPRCSGHDARSYPLQGRLSAGPQPAATAPPERLRWDPLGAWRVRGHQVHEGKRAAPFSASFAFKHVVASLALCATIVHPMGCRVCVCTPT